MQFFTCRRQSRRYNSRRIFRTH